MIDLGDPHHLTAYVIMAAGLGMMGVCHWREHHGRGRSSPP